MPVAPITTVQPQAMDKPASSMVGRSLYASIVDPDTGTSLKYVPALSVNRIKCAQIKPKDVKSKIEFWKSAALCKVLGANPPLEEIEGFCRRIWSNYCIDKVCLVNHGL